MGGTMSGPCTIPETVDLRFLVSRRDLARRLGCTTRTVAKWTLELGLPARRIAGNGSVYYLPTTQRWLRTRPELVRKHREAVLVN